MPIPPKKWNVGSRWLRWEPHIHAPGTLLNDQYGGDWDAYIAKINNAAIPPAVLGITDYFTLRTYERVLARKDRFPGVSLIFPNIELRLSIETSTGSGINIHLLVSPEDPEHLTLIKERLGRLTFEYEGQPYPCSDAGLARLGRAFKKNPSLEEEAALSEGARQYKVGFELLREIYERDEWLQRNVLVAVAAAGDGIGGLAGDSGFTAIRREIAKFAHIVFSGKPSDRNFWLGRHPDFESNGYTEKPCLHGSDAHKIETVLEPAQGRVCWVRAEPTFEGLRQTLAEPERRVFIGEIPPGGPVSGEAIKKVVFTNTPWMKREALTLNQGLVTIIGARGSGKTALADLLAFAAESDDDVPGEASFISKAKDLLPGSKTEIVWGNDFSMSSTWPREPEAGKAQTVRYLSQKFVDLLCTPQGLSEPLVEELERIVFNSLPLESRLQCSTFDELRELRLIEPQAQQKAEQETIRTKTRLIADRLKIKGGIPKIREELQEATRKRVALDTEFKAIPINASDEKTKQLAEVEARIIRLQEMIAGEQRKCLVFRDLLGDINRQVSQSTSFLQSLKDTYVSLLSDDEWELLRFKPNDAGIPALLAKEKAIQEWILKLNNDGGTSAIENGLEALNALKNRISQEIGLDATNAKKRLEIQKKLTQATTAESGLQIKLRDAERSDEIIEAARQARSTSYKSLFTAMAQEQVTLGELYEPLKTRLEADKRLEKLSFSIDRTIDLGTWVREGEKLFDLRKEPFRGEGALEAAAKRILLPAWTSGIPEEIGRAIEAFSTEFGREALKALSAGYTPLNFGLWLFSTGHIHVRYGVQYEGVDLHRLSPGARGIVLLTLYLGLDEWDQRPLVVDQPEENLDPQSVFSQLVPFFKDAARRRQIIMVTHNANLVVNTDSDQVIIASSKRVAPDQLPEISYVAGGLEEPEIRAEICNILEGGEEAFKRRSMRYSIK